MPRRLRTRSIARLRLPGGIAMSIGRAGKGVVSDGKKEGDLESTTHGHTSVQIRSHKGHWTLTKESGAPPKVYRGGKGGLTPLCATRGALFMEV